MGHSTEISGPFRMALTAFYAEQYFCESVNIAQSTLATCKMHTHEPRIDES